MWKKQTSFSVSALWQIRTRHMAQDWAICDKIVKKCMSIQKIKNAHTTVQILDGSMLRYEVDPCKDSRGLQHIIMPFIKESYS